MTHTVTGKLNRAANEHISANGTTFFVSIGEKNYDFKNKKAVWTNYEAAVFAKDSQVEYYRDALVEGAIVSVTGKGIIPADEGQYGIKLAIQDAKIVGAWSTGAAQQRAPQQRPQQAPPADDFDGDIPF